MNSLQLQVVHPVFRLLNNSCRLLHLTAASLLLIHALSHAAGSSAHAVYVWCQVIVAADIILLVFAGRQVLSEYPKVNLFFRGVEFLFFLGIALSAMFTENWLSAVMHFLLASFYVFLFHCEKKLRTDEIVGIYHTGISVAALPSSLFFKWSEIDRLEATYDAICIHTSHKGSFTFPLVRNLDFGELGQIHEFCRHYLGQDVYQPR